MKIDFLKQKCVVYTAIFGGKDSIPNPTKFPNVDYVCFTDDSNLTSDVWEIRYCGQRQDPKRAAKIFKILPHKYFKKYNYSLWVDATHSLISNPIELVKEFLINDNMACFSHETRNCIYSEAIPAGWRAVRYGENPSIVKKQMNRYKIAKYPEKNGLISGGFLLRKHMENDVISLMNYWWSEIVNGSIRDQLSFNYCAYFRKFSYTVIPGNIYKNKYFNIKRHLK